jgi:CHAD domain-containing protein
MAYRFSLKRGVSDNARRIALEQIERARARCDVVENPETLTHDLRKYCKKLRGLARLVRSELERQGRYADDNAFFRDTAERLGAMRDAEAMIETYDKLLVRYAAEIERGRVAPVRSSLTRLAQRVSEGAGQAKPLAEFRSRLDEAEARVMAWRFANDDFEGIRNGLVTTYRSGRRAMKTAFAEPTGETLHEWRKFAKYHWYHLRLLEQLWRDDLKPRRRAARELTEILGDHHDLGLLRAHLAGKLATGNRPAETIAALIDRRAGELVDEARVLGKRLYAAKPRALGAEMARLWQARIEEISVKKRVLPVGPTGLEPVAG